MFLLHSLKFLLAVKHKNCFIGCVNGQIILGSVNSVQFEETCCVVIPTTDIVDFYCALIKLFALIATGPYPSNNVNFLQFYFWQALSRNHIILAIEKNGSQKSLEFDYESFNSLIFCFCKILFISLELKEKEKILFHEIASLPSDAIISLKDPHKCYLFCKTLNEIEMNDAFNLSVLVAHYMDIIIIYKKLLSVWDESFNKANIEKILTSNL